MNYLFSLFTLFFSITIGYSQPPVSPISILRYNDNFSSLKNQSVKKGTNVFKYISVGKENFLSFGGELREQYQYFNNINFGDIPPTYDKQSAGQLWHRAMVHGNLELGTRLRVFAQINSTFRFFNPNPIAPEVDENRLSLHQAFVDYMPNTHWSMRVGRQEMGYGNSRILSFREGPNTRLTFDAAVIKYSSANRKIDLMALTPVISNQYAFDDESFKEYMVGIYGSEMLIPKKMLLDYYFFNFNSSTRRYNYISGSENRQTLGLRLFSQNQRINYELESAYQMGKFNNATIAAYAFTADINYKIDLKSNLVLGLQTNLMSGDRDRTDNKLNTYNALFSKPQFGLAAPIGSSNISSINPYVKMSPIKKLSIYTGVYFLERQSNQDGTYSPAMTEVRPRPMLLFASKNKIIGTQYAFEAQYHWNANFSTAMEGAYIAAGNYVKETGKGQDISYTSVKATYKF